MRLLSGSRRHAAEVLPGVVIPGLVSFAGLVAVGRVAGPATLGLFSLAWVTATFGAALLATGPAQAAARAIASGEPDPAPGFRGAVLHRILVAVPAAAAAGGILIVLNQRSFGVPILYGAIWSAPQSVMAYEVEAMRAARRFRSASALTATRSVLAWSASTLVAALGGGVGLIVVPQVAFTLLLSFAVNKARYRRPDGQQRVALRQYGRPGTILTFASYALAYADRYVVLGVLGAAAAGIYTLGYQLGEGALELVASPINAALLPRIVSEWRSPGGPQIALETARRGSAVILLAGVAAMSGAVAASALGLFRVVSSDPHLPAVAIIVVLAVAAQGTVRLSESLLLAQGRPGVSARCFFQALVPSAVAVGLGTYYFGIIGTAEATLFGYGLLAILTYRASRHLPEPERAVAVGGHPDTWRPPLKQRLTPSMRSGSIRLAMLTLALGLVAEAFLRPGLVPITDLALAGVTVAYAVFAWTPVSFVAAFLLVTYYPLQFLSAHRAGPALLGVGILLDVLLLRTGALKELRQRWSSRHAYLIAAFPVLIVMLATIRTHPLDQYAVVRAAILLGVCVGASIAGSLHWDHPPYFWIVCLGLPLVVVLNVKPSLFPLQNPILAGHACWMTVAAAYYLPSLPRPVRLLALVLGLRAVYNIGETGPMVAAGSFAIFAAFEHMFLGSRDIRGRRRSLALFAPVLVGGGALALKLSLASFQHKSATRGFAGNTVAQRSATYSQVLHHATLLGHGLAEIQLRVSGAATLVIGSAHNFVLDFLNVAGVVGLVALGVILVMGVRRIGIRFGSAMLGAVLVGLLFSGGVENPELWYVLGACLAGRVARGAAVEPSHSPVPDDPANHPPAHPTRVTTASPRPGRVFDRAG